MSLASNALPKTVARRAIRIRGAVQGVGFRPFVWRLAHELELAGWVRNDPCRRGDRGAGTGRPPGRIRRAAGARSTCARTHRRHRDARAARRTRRRDFHIVASRAGRANTGIAADTAVCADCLEELFDPRDRRYRYAFINCTNCGPRYTISRALPYDRANTSMAAFALCPTCRSEYGDPGSRRFHAQPNACADCGPALALCDSAGMRLHEGDVVAAALARLERGEIVAVKGLGGFHLACDARNAAAVARLRARKAREEKPFAVMVAGSASLRSLADVRPAERALLESRERPIVLLQKKTGCDARLAGVAPGVARLGAMLPCTPLQYLLFHQAAGRPDGRPGWIAAQPLVLVMTSANAGGEPLIAANAEALARLGAIADAFVLHDRDIVVRCDDSVVRASGERPRVHPARARLHARADPPCPRRSAGARAWRLSQEHGLRHARG